MTTTENIQKPRKRRERQRALAQEPLRWRTLKRGGAIIEYISQNEDVIESSEATMELEERIDRKARWIFGGADYP